MKRLAFTPFWNSDRLISVGFHERTCRFRQFTPLSAHCRLTKEGFKMLKRIIIFAAVVLILSSIALANPYFNILADIFTVQSQRELDKAKDKQEFIGTIKELYAAEPPKGILGLKPGEIMTYFILKEHPGRGFIVKLEDAEKWGLLVAEMEPRPGGGSVRCKGWKVKLSIGKNLIEGQSNKEGKVTCYEVISIKKLVQVIK